MVAPISLLRSQSPLLDRLPREWDHPHPYGWIAMIKSAVNAIEDAVNGSAIAMNVSPKTEEEAYQYNQARDRGVAGAFDAASKFGPPAPAAVAGILARNSANLPSLIARSGQPIRVASGLQTVGSRSASLLPRTGELPAELYGRPDLKMWPPALLDREGVPAGLLGRLVDFGAVRPGDSGGSIADTPQVDPNIRTLARLQEPVPKGEISGTDGDQQAVSSEVPETDSPNYLPDFPEWLARRAYKKFPRKGRGNGGQGGGGKGNGGGQDRNWDDDDPCGTEGAARQAECWARREDYAHPDYLWGCIDRAKTWTNWCRRPNGKPEPLKWIPPDEETWRNYGR